MIIYAITLALICFLIVGPKQLPTTRKDLRRFIGVNIALIILIVVMLVICLAVFIGGLS